MKFLAFITIAVLVSGCSQPGGVPYQDLLTECFSQAAYEAYVAEQAVKPVAKCCDGCKGTGKVKSGDGIAWVACPCPETCPCKKK